MTSLDELEALAGAVLVAANTSAESASETARVLVAADADGLASHGVSRVPFYADQAQSGKVNGNAVPTLEAPRSGLIRVDAQDGFAYPAIRLALDSAMDRLPANGVVVAAIANSHHFGAAGFHVESVSAQGAVALGFSNSPAAMAPWGGSKGSFGTNPIAFACPRNDRPPLVIDLSLSQVARGKVMLAAKQGEPIPDDWALNAAGVATTDPEAALQGTMLPTGGVKGASLALMVEILTAALTGSQFAFEAGSFFTAEGAAPRIGQSFILIDQAALAANFGERLEHLLNHILSQDGTRLPGERRLANRERARREGVAIPAELIDDLQRRAAR